MADFLDSLVDSASDYWGSFDLNKFIPVATQAYVAIKKAGQQGQLPPAGTVRRLPDGSIARTNPDGTLTLTAPTGAQSLIGGSAISPTMLLIGGAVGLGLLFVLLRR